MEQGFWLLTSLCSPRVALALMGALRRTCPKRWYRKGQAQGALEGNPLWNGQCGGREDCCWSLLRLLQGAGQRQTPRALTPLMVKPHLAFVGLGSGNS